MNARDLVGERYVDALGTLRVVPEQTRTAFAAALEAAVPAAEPLVAPTRVLREGQPLTLDVTLPAENWSAEVLWTLSGGSGVRAGTLRLQDAPVIGYALHGPATHDTRRLTIPVALPVGAFRLTLDIGTAGHAGIAVIVAPGQAFLGPMQARVWGIAVQLYAVRSERNWGIGDFGDLERLCGLAAEAGASYVGINPLHASHRSDPEAASPYAPASRRFLNWLAIEVTAVPEAQAAPMRSLIAELADELAALRAAPLVDYTAVARVKERVLRRCFETLAGWRAAAFRTYSQHAGSELRMFAVFEALVAAYGRDLAAWPAELRRPEMPGVEAFAAAHRQDVGFGMYLQWCAAEQLNAVAQRAAARGVQLYRDLAVGCESGAADLWGNPDYVRIATIGAPADALNPQGQDWGLPPLSPTALPRDGYAGVAALLADNMRAAGALRIDHAMSLMRLFWIPRGGTPLDGAYVAYPFDDLLAIVARESVRARCVVIGEDLGTVPDGFRERMAAEQLLSYRLLLFCREADGSFTPADRYPALALSATGTHDLPPLLGWLAGDDIALRRAIGLLDAKAAEAERALRGVDRALLIEALRRGGDLTEVESDDDAIVAAAYRFLARTPSRIVMVQLDDVTGETTPVNVPGTYREHPNWRRKLSCDLESLATDGKLERFATVLRGSRPRT